MRSKMAEAHVVRDFVPDNEFTRHSEGSFLRLHDGRILFAYSRFTMPEDAAMEAWYDFSPSDIVGIFSSDEGENWTEPEILIPRSLFGAVNVMSVSLMRMKNGEIGMFYFVAQTLTVSRIMLSRSDDEGRTWHEHTEITRPDRRGYYVLNNDRVERLPSGRILLATAFHRTGSMPDAGYAGYYFDGRGCIFYYYSDDDGATWQEVPDSVSASFPGSRTNLQEPGLIRLNNGVIWAYFRTDRMYQYQSYSLDEGLHWTTPEPSRFTSPDSPMKIARRAETGELYALWNPIPMYNDRNGGKAAWGRTPLVFAVSTDEGVSWSESTVIEGNPECGYCYPAVFFTADHAMLTAYCSGGPADGDCLARMTMMKLPL